MFPALGAKQGGLLLEGEADMAVGRQFVVELAAPRDAQ